MNLPSKFYSGMGKFILETRHFTPGNRSLYFHAPLNFPLKKSMTGIGTDDLNKLKIETYLLVINIVQ